MKIGKFPTIKLRIDGLFLLVFGENNNRCELGVLAADRHCFNIEVKLRRKDTGDFETLALFPAEFLTGDIHLEVQGRTEGIQVNTDHSGIRREKKDFSWVIDHEDASLFSGKVRFKPTAKFQRIIIHQGTFYTDEKFEVSLKTGRSTEAINVEAAKVIGCNINLGTEEKAYLRFGAGLSQQMTFEPRDDGVYVIDIKNSCLTPSEEGGEEEGDFKHVYDLLEVAEPDRITVSKADPENPEHPCIGCLLGQHTTLSN